MHVVATAGHVDHGKSTLVRALTGMDPDRLAEERRRGLSIQLGYCWTTLPEVGEVAFVDVPGHERFVSTMLSGIGPVPAVLFVVAADDPWMPQAAEHLAALDALGVRRGVLAVTRADLADPAPALARARAELARTSLRGAPAVTVSGRTAQGLDQLRARLVDLVRALPSPPVGADVRLWVDRCFPVKGAGTVVTGTLPAGRVTVGDALAVDDQVVRVRGIETLGRAADTVTGVARVALNVAGAGVEQLGRGSVLVTPGAWELTDLVDVRLENGPDARPDAATPDPRIPPRLNTEEPSTQQRVPERSVLHVGACSVAVRVRPLGDGLARIALDRALPLRIGDRALLRDPGSRRVWGVTVLDPVPAPLPRRRGAAAEVARGLAGLDGTPALAAEVARRDIVRVSALRRWGIDVSAAQHTGVLVGDWLLDDGYAAVVRRRLETVVQVHDRDDPLHPGVPLAELAQELGLPTPDLVPALVREPLRIVEGRVRSALAAVLPDALERALDVLRDDLSAHPFAAPTADRLGELGLDGKAVAAAAKAGRLLRVAPGIVLLPGAEELAVTRLAELAQPFSTSEARVRLETTRRVVLPLLALLDRLGRTERLLDDRRTVRTR
ncbi:MAG TPA: SelB C-terminal domain-containing protein [Nocardioidaceae bacterium]|nr:SelB C-terminal domain-containing protein [Nocardioidaceae bacterium]